MMNIKNHQLFIILISSFKAKQHQTPYMFDMDEIH